jgi:hypothetical protein
MQSAREALREAAQYATMAKQNPKLASPAKRAIMAITREWATDSDDEFADETGTLHKGNKLNGSLPEGERGGGGQSVKEQLRMSSDMLGKMNSVASIGKSGIKKYDKTAYISALDIILDASDNKITASDGDEVIFDERRRKEGHKYLKTDADAEAAVLVPTILQKGVVISGHENHKGREYSTKTYAAPVNLDGKRANMAVVTKQTTDNFYKLHKILTPDGKEIVLDDK